MIRDIREHLEARPFEPFNIVTTSGKAYPVPTAEHAGLNPKGTRVIAWADDGAGVTISGLHITSIEKEPGVLGVDPKG